MRYALPIAVVLLSLIASPAVAGESARNSKSLSRSVERSLNRSKDCKSVKESKRHAKKSRSRAVKKERGALTISRKRERSASSSSTR